MDPSHGLTILDYSVLGIVLLSGLLALMRGFVREVLSLAAWAGAYFAAANYFPMVEPWAHGYVKNATGATALAAVVVFVVVLTVLTIAGYFIAKLIRGRTLTAIDRSLGFLFGLMRGVLVVCLVYLGATYIPWLNMDKLDNPDAKPQIELDTANAASPGEKDKEKDKEKEKEKPPEWLVDSKTRPTLAYGANILKVFIPEKAIEKTMQQYDEQNAAAHKNLNEKLEEKMGDMVGMPAKPQEKPDQSQSPAYDSQSRSNLDRMIEQKSTQ